MQGFISVKSCVDRESQSSYALTIIAKDNPTDNNLQKTSSTTVFINILDINDNAPVFDKHTFHASIREDNATGPHVITVTATDLDLKGTCNSNVTYFVKSDLFQIDSRSGEITTKTSLVDKVGEYNITIEASDCGTPQMNGTAVVVINVQDVNLHKPHITNISNNGKISVLEVMLLVIRCTSLLNETKCVMVL